MKKILGPDFIVNLTNYRDQWLHMGISSHILDRARISHLIESVYLLIGFERPSVAWCGSPLEAVKYLITSKDTTIFNKISHIIAHDWETVVSFGKTFKLKLAEEQQKYDVPAIIEDEIPVALFSLRPFWSISLIETEINEQSIDAFEEAKTLYEEIAYCGFFERELGAKLQYSLNPLFELCENCSWWIPCEKQVIVSENPVLAYITNNEQVFTPVLHHDGGPALLYPDGFAIYALNGIRVPKEIAVAPHSSLDPHLLLHESNADVRREIVRKIGIERICQELNARTIDSYEDYELLILDIGDGRRRPYLKMKNPSIGVYHVEGVPPEIKTVKEALSWRNGTDEKPFLMS